MIDQLPFDKHLYVERQPITNELITHLFQSTIDPRYKRSLIIEGAGGSGKSCLLQDIYRKCTSQPQDSHVQSSRGNVDLLVLLVTRNMFRATQPFVEPDDLFLPFVTNLLTVTREYDARLAGLIPPLTRTSVDITNDLNSLATTLNQLKPAPYLLILFDGMEEILEESERMAKQNIRLQQSDLLYRFEKTCLLPLFKYDNVRLLATRRTGASAQWRTFGIKARTEVWQLPFLSTNSTTLSARNDMVLEQFARIVIRKTKKSISLTQSQNLLAMLQAQVPVYEWNHPGTNACLIDAALNEDDGTIAKAALRACIDKALASPTGTVMQADVRTRLFRLIEHYPELSTGVNIGEIGRFLNVSDIARTEFISELQKSGIGVSESYQFRVHSHIVALVREWQQRP